MHTFLPSLTTNELLRRPDWQSVRRAGWTLAGGMRLYQLNSILPTLISGLIEKGKSAANSWH